MEKTHLIDDNQIDGPCNVANLTPGSEWQPCSSAAVRAAGGEIVYEQPPAMIVFLEMFPWLCQKLYPLLLGYAIVFFIVPWWGCTSCGKNCVSLPIA
jgi:hypothetical protein